MADELRHQAEKAERQFDREIQRHRERAAANHEHHRESTLHEIHELLGELRQEVREVREEVGKMRELLEPREKAAGAVEPETTN
jgi:polyhydroxyalkanoate synthesis regulator phasin